jgi:hypothetical protein
MRCQVSGEAEPEGETFVDAILAIPWETEFVRVAISGLVFASGFLVSRLWEMYRRHRQLRRAEQGQSDEVVTIEKIVVDRRPDGTEVLRLRSCGRDTIETVFPSRAARDAFETRVNATTPTAPLVSMDGKLGSYLLQELAIWVCGQLRERSFRHDAWIMAPVYERGTLYLGGHFLSTVILIRQTDLARFRDWDRCSGILVEHGSHGERILTLMAMAREYDRQTAAIEERRADGRPSNFEETMYILDLAIDTEAVDLRSRPVPWERFDDKVKAIGARLNRATAGRR